MLDIPMIKNVLLVHYGGERIAELRDMIFGTQEKLFKYASILFKAYLVSVLMCATLYLCSPIYLMIVRRDKSLRLLGKLKLLIMYYKILQNTPSLIIELLISPR